MRHARITSQKPLFTVEQIQRDLHIRDWKTARFVRRQLSEVVRSLWGGHPLIYDPELQFFKIRLKHKKKFYVIPAAHVRYIDAYYGLEWCDVKIGRLAA